MADPVAVELMEESVAAGQTDPTRDKEMVVVIGSLPMTSLAGFKGMSLDYDTLDKLVECWRVRTGQR